MRATAILVFACAVGAVPVRANDTTAEVAAGGLTLTRTDAIRMDSEDLYISPDIVRVKYRFTNTTDLPIDALVAFPLPDIPPDLYTWDPLPPIWDTLNFKTSVDGRPLALKLVEQAFFKGEDVSARLSALNIPLDPLRVAPAIKSLPESDRDRLAAAGLISDSYMYDWVGLWTVRMTWTRHQTFPPQKTITVEHEYSPKAGGGRDEPGAIRDPQHRTSDRFLALRRMYCIDDDWLLNFDKKLENKDHEFEGTTLGYVLKTGANWKGPIGDFRLVVDKGKPDSLVSFCAEGVKQISPTQFEVRHANFTPTEDLNILIVDWFEHPKTGGQNGGSDSVNRTIDELLGDHAKYQQFILTLQKAVIDHAAAGVAALVSYPVRIELDGKTTIIRTPKAFIRNYNRIITPAIARVIEQQKYGDLFANWHGVMFGRGEVWITGICVDSRCKRFNVKVVTIQDTSNLDNLDRK